MVCNKKHRYSKKFELLPDAQDNQKGGRHICAGCAYEAGECDGKAGRLMKADLRSLSLPYSQAGTVRHKDAYEAYKLGYSEACL